MSALSLSQVVSGSDKKIGLVHVTQSSRSGAARYVYELFKEIYELHPEAVLVCPQGFEYLGKLAPNAFLPVLQFSGRGRFGKLWSMWKQNADMTRKIASAADDFRGMPVFVHFNFPAIPILALPQFITLRKRGLKVVLTVHDAIPHRWMLPSYLNFIERWILKRLYLAADGLVVHHMSQRDVLLFEFGVSKERILETHHGVFRLSEEPLPYFFKSERIFLCFGAIRRNKGVHLAVEAIQRLREQGVPARLRIVGAVSQGERQYWEDCLRLIKARPDGIEVVERFVGEDEVKGFFQDSDFCLLPYDDFFSQSGVAMMALSSGRAIVSTAAGGLGGLIGTGQFGVEIKDVSVEGVVAAIDAACRLDVVEIERMGRDAFFFAGHNYSWATAAKQQLDFYKKIADGAMISASLS